MSLGIVFKGPEGIVFAADSRVTLNAQVSDGKQIPRKGASGSREADKPTDSGSTTGKLSTEPRGSAASEDSEQKK